MFIYVRVNLIIILLLLEAYLGSCQASMIKLFYKYSEQFKVINFLEKSSIIDVLQGADYASVYGLYL